MMRWLVLLLLAIGLAVSSLAGPTRVLAEDIPADVVGHWSEGVYRSIPADCRPRVLDDGSFRPDQPVAAAELVRILQAARQSPVVPDASTTMVNPPSGDSLYTLDKISINYLHDQPISRADTARLVALVMGGEKLGLAETGLPTPFMDNDVMPPELTGYIRFVARWGLMVGNPKGNVEPARALTRAEAMVVAGLVRPGVDLRNRPHMVTLEEGWNIPLQPVPEKLSAVESAIHLSFYPTWSESDLRPPQGPSVRVSMRNQSDQSIRISALPVYVAVRPVGESKPAWMAPLPLPKFALLSSEATNLRVEWPMLGWRRVESKRFEFYFVQVGPVAFSTDDGLTHVQRVIPGVEAIFEFPVS